jgi:FdhE protein
MTRNFFQRLLAPSPTLSPEVEEARGELERLASQRQELAGPAGLLRDVLPILYRDPSADAAPALSGEAASAKLASGLPLLRGEHLELDPKAFQQRWTDICAVMHRHQKTDESPRLAEALRGGKLNARELTDGLLSGQPENVHARAEALDLDAGLMATVLRLTLFPVLSSLQTKLLPLRGETGWRLGYCPTCGSWPLLGEFRGLEQIRYLRCGLCAADWEFPRLQCPFCGTRDHRALGYLHVEAEEGKWRAATCDACHGYVKILSTLTPLTGPQLLVQELTSMHLDLAAAERGFMGQPCQVPEPGAEH